MNNLNGRDQQHHDDHRCRALVVVDDHHRDDAYYLQRMRQEQAALNIPPGWRFCPTDVELIDIYLKRKVGKSPQLLTVNRRIVDIDIYDYTPMKLAARYQLPEDPDMFFFTPRQRKYTNGKRPDRTITGKYEKDSCPENKAYFGGFWKATGADKPIIDKGKIIGRRKTLVFFQGKQPKGKKTNWLMQEYVLEKKPKGASKPSSDSPQNNNELFDKWALCKIYNTKQNKLNKKNVGHETNTNYEEEAGSSSSSSSASASASLISSQAQDNQALVVLDRSHLPSPITEIGSSSSVPNCGQSNMMNYQNPQHYVTQQQETQDPLLLNRMGMYNNQGGHGFNGSITSYQHLPPQKNPGLPSPTVGQYNMKNYYYPPPPPFNGAYDQQGTHSDPSMLLGQQESPMSMYSMPSTSTMEIKNQDVHGFNGAHQQGTHVAPTMLLGTQENPMNADSMTPTPTMDIQNQDGCGFNGSHQQGTQVALKVVLGPQETPMNMDSMASTATTDIGNQDDKFNLLFDEAQPLYFDFIDFSMEAFDEPHPLCPPPLYREPLDPMAPVDADGKSTTTTTTGGGH